ncbi:MAG: PadR family transcriptional regulator [Coriobacteriales bacterium]|jgi:PadR family transcriptional regulator PadR|nr:PadR family transcriptional regulator [Coriobacteriales bacterium]
MFQLGSALLDACVLAVISKSDAYGYLLTQEIRNIIEVSESTLYPVLRRLQSEEMLVTYDSQYNGRNRRYYQITPRGREHLAFLQDNWQHFKAAVDYLLITTPSVSSTEGGQS